MATSENLNRKSSQGKILKKLPDDLTCLVTWITKSGKKYYVILEKGKRAHTVYKKVTTGYQKIYKTNDYYSIERELNKYE